MSRKKSRIQAIFVRKSRLDRSDGMVAGPFCPLEAICQKENKTFPFWVNKK